MDDDPRSQVDQDELQRRVEAWLSLDALDNPFSVITPTRDSLEKAMARKMIKEREEQ